MQPDHDTIYCESCSFPIFYCQFRSAAKLKALGCKNLLMRSNPELFQLIYNEEVEEIVENEQPQQENSEESESQTQNDGKSLKIPISLVPPFGLPIKPQLKKASTYVPILQIRLASRGQHKSTTQVFNYEDFIEDPQQLCKELGKQFAASAGVADLVDGNAQVIQIQGSFVEEIIQLMIQKGVPVDQIYEAKEGKHKGKKKAQSNARPANKK
ncbi:Translation initiation factor SUI1 family protein [Spironucleus salmonicida]|uniref:Translation initiation factor SUI1 family protein n=1 Tax=Spironucleus salmonicida TaxID=348837 RepID=V6LPQ4_9EUKA|nr:Translation initiation factor SUI1 family protein [Spironucleus salmonicida]|eukprot:EST46213.1 Translation initiation factor SUI1 family protein [Spironucleus salmonicida]